MDNRSIQYINRDYSDFKSALIEYAKTYFPTTYNDFSPASPGMMFMEMVSAIGDVQSFYIDNQIQETFRQYARQQQNVYSLAYTAGYFPRATKAAEVEISVFQIVPAILSGSTYIPDMNYSLYIPANTEVRSSNNTTSPFIIEDVIDFSFSSSFDTTEISVYEINVSTNNPETFLLTKKRKAISAQIKTKNITVGTAERFYTSTINDENIIGILDIIDSDGNQWYEVPYLGQELYPVEVRNTFENDPNYNDNDARFLLKLEKQPRRFITRFQNDKNLQIQFGAGTNQDFTEEVIPNPNNIGLGLPYGRSNIFTAFDPRNFLQTDTYGVAPSNTTLTVRYLVGGGVEANVNAGELNVISRTGVRFNNTNLPQTSATNTYFNSLQCINESAASGGGDGDTLEEIKQNAMSSFNAQLRTVTTEDYIVRAMSMPARLGTVAKAYADISKVADNSNSNLILYVLGYNSNKELTTVSNTVKNNLRTYLSQFRTLNDSIEVRDAFIINIGINFDIITLPGYNGNEVLVKCIDTIKQYFDVDKQQINQPILLRDLYVRLDKIKGVQTVKNIEVINKSGIVNGYSKYAYGIEGATINNVIYPSLDPCIFEIKYPDVDIKGRIVNL